MSGDEDPGLGSFRSLLPVFIDLSESEGWELASISPSWARIKFAAVSKLHMKNDHRAFQTQEETILFCSNLSQFCAPICAWVSLKPISFREVTICCVSSVSITFVPWPWWMKGWSSLWLMAISYRYSGNLWLACKSTNNPPFYHVTANDFTG